MRYSKRFQPTKRVTAAVAAAGLLCLIGGGDLRAQTDLFPSTTSNGGDNRDLPGGGDMNSTIGEPVAGDSLGTIDDKATWTGFWQVMPADPDTTTGVPTDPTGGTFAIVSTTPEPFTTEVEFEISLPKAGMVRLDVYDMLGRRTSGMDAGRREAGTLRMRWRPEGVEAGSYMAQLVIDGNPVSARLLHYAR